MDDSFLAPVLMNSSLTRNFGTTISLPSFLSGIFDFIYEDLLYLTKLAFSDSHFYDPVYFLSNYGRFVSSNARELLGLEKQRD